MTTKILKNKHNRLECKVKISFVNKWRKNIFNETYKATIVPKFDFKIFEDRGYNIFYIKIDKNYFNE